MRERGSSTARPTEKGGGGLPIGSRFGRFGRFRRVASCRLGRFRRVASCRLGRVASVSARRVVPIGSCRVGFGASIGSIRSISARRVDSTHRGRCRHRRQDTKKPDSSIGESGCSYRKASRALNLPLVPLANTRASARSVRLGLARRSCIVMITSDHRHIVHYTLQNMRTRERS